MLWIRLVEILCLPLVSYVTTICYRNSMGCRMGAGTPSQQRVGIHTPAGRVGTMLPISYFAYDPESESESESESDRRSPGSATLVRVLHCILFGLFVSISPNCWVTCIHWRMALPENIFWIFCFTFSSSMTNGLLFIILTKSLSAYFSTIMTFVFQVAPHAR